MQKMMRSMSVGQFLQVKVRLCQKFRSDVAQR